MAVSNFNLQANFSLAQQRAHTLANLARGYVFPKNDCMKQIQWVAYRVWNAIKSIFGMSDWQKAISIIHEARMTPGALPPEGVGERPTDESILKGILAQLNRPPVAPLQRLAPIVPRVQLEDQNALQRVVASVPPFNSYQIGKDGHSLGVPLSAVSLRPSNLFFMALGAEVTLPGQALFAFNNPNKVRADIMNADPNGIVAFSANGIGGNYRLEPRQRWIPIPNLAVVYGGNTYRISYQELQDTLNSQKIFCAPRLPKLFYQDLKHALLLDNYVVLPGSDRVPVLLKNIIAPACKALIDDAREHPERYGFRHRRELIALLNLSLYQIGSLVVKIEDFRLFADGNGNIFERNAGEEDAFRLINVCGIRGIRNHGNGNDQLHETIMKETFSTTLQAAENGFILFPAIGMGVWRGDPHIYWRALFEAIAKSGNGLEKILINPRHAPSIDGQYQGKTGEECAEILNDFIAFYQSEGNDAAVTNLQKVINLYEEKTDLLQLAYALKKNYPSKIISLVNASDPDVTLGNHTTEYSNNCPHGASTTEEHYSMLGTNGLCFERITRVHDDDRRIIQTQ